MPASPHPLEAERLASLHAHAILDTAREVRFDRVVYMTAQILRAPMAMISFVAADGQWFKASVGIAPRQARLGYGFCPFAILEEEILVVEDAQADPRFLAMPVVIGAPFIRFYVGVPLRSEDGFPLGTLCAVDTKARMLAPGQTRNLKALAREVEQLLSRADA
jgi:GAF domain-containing protein